MESKYIHQGGRKSLKCVHYPNQKDFKNEIVMDCDSDIYRGNKSPLSQTVTLPNEPQDRFDPPPSLKPEANLLKKYNLIISLDTEFEEFEGVDGKRENFILSYQYSALYQPKPGVWTGAEAVIDVDNNRWTLGDIFARVLKSFGIGWRLAENMRVMLVWHYGLAEWAALKDREVIVEDLQFVRNAPVTFKAMELVVKDRHRNYATLKVDVADTYLLSPGGEQGLMSISKVTSHKKLELEEGVIKEMGNLKRDNPVLFKSYGINDCRVTLEYYLNVVHKLESILGLKKAPTTLGGGAVSAYTKYLDEHPKLDKHTVFGFYDKPIITERGYKRVVQSECTTRNWSNNMAAHAYYGGLNVAYYKGEYSDPEKVILDLDFSGAYPAALATLPVIDWSLHPKDLRDLSHLPASLEDYTPVSFMEVEFKFPDDCLYPCLPVPTQYGLIYPLEGKTVVTGIEVALARKLGADVKVRKANYFDNISELAFADYLKMLAQKRAEYARETLENKLLKEIANSFYGKLAQGIRGRNIYNYMEGMQPLEPSAITCPHYAAMCTGIVRAALSSMVYELSETPGVQVLSATTDGCMVAMPKRRELRADVDGKVIKDFKFHEVYPEVYERLKSYTPIQTLALGRRNMGLEEDTWLEIKEAGDKAMTWKTRGNDISFQCVSQHVARAGHKVNSADELYKIDASPKVGKYPFERLASFKDIITGVEKDLVNIDEERRTNLDWDWKRKPVGEIGVTRPVKNVMETDLARKASDKVRNRGDRATVKAVMAKLDGKDLNMKPVVIKRTVYKAIAHDYFGCRPVDMTDKEISATLGISYDNFRQYKSRPFQPQSLVPTSEHMVVFKEVIKSFPGYNSINLYKAVFCK